MDWMYDGIQIQKEDYLLGKKVDKKFGESTDNNDTNLPPQICPTNNTFSQVDLTKKILEDPLVNIKKREIECTQKILQNPMRLKKQQNIKKEKHTIEDHKLDMIIVSRLKSFQKAGLDLKEILSITKHKGKKEQKTKRKRDHSSSEEDEQSDQDEKMTYKPKTHVQKSNNFDREDKRQNDKKSFEYRDHRRNGNKSRNGRHSSVSSSDDKGTSKRNKTVNEYKNQRNSNPEYKGDHKRHSSVRDKNNHSSLKKRNDRQRSTSVEKHGYINDKYSKNNYRNNLPKEEENKKKYEKPKYKQQEDKSRDRKHDNKRYESGSSDREPEHGKPNDSSDYSKYKSKSNEHNRLNSPDREHKLKDSKDSRNRHEYHKKLSNRRSRSESPQKQRNHQRTDKIKKAHHKNVSSSSSSSDDERKNNSQMKQTSKRQHTAELELDDAKHVQNDKDEYQGRKDYGLFVPKGNIKDSPHCPPSVKISKTSTNVKSKSPPVKKKKLTDEEMEKLRKEMMKDAKIRDKERSSNVKRYKNEEKKEEEKQKPYSKEFLIKQLAHAASQVTVERSIKSNVNKLQKNNNSIAD